MSILKDCFETIIKSLCDEPEIMSIEWRDLGHEVYVDVRPAEDDIKKLIGKNGVVANAIRTILHATHAREKKKTYLSIRS